MNNDSFNNTDGGFVRPNNIIKFAGGFMNNQILESQGTEANGMQDAEVSPEVQENINLVSLFGSQKDDSQAKAMTLLANQTAAFFHTPDLEAYATINEGGIQKNIRVRSKTAELWLSRLIYNATQNVPNSSSLKAALNTLEGKALFDGPETEIYLRYAFHNGSIYIDLGNENWDQVEISAVGRRILSSNESPVKFRREKGMAAMSYPSENGSWEPLRDILSLENNTDFNLIVGWLIAAMNPKGPFPIMTLIGEQGSSKSTTAKLLKDLTDPATIDLVALPRSERELAIAAKKTWTLPYDNLSKLSSSIADAFCRLATGGGFRTRTLYTDDSEMLFNSVRPIIMNGIADFITRQDLADRAIIINLASIPSHKRIPEKQLKERWEIAKPIVFGALCDALSMYLQNIGQTNLAEYPRMADFVQLVTAAEPALPWKNGGFIEAYSNNIKKIIDIALEADDVAAAVIALMDRSVNGEWIGKATDLMTVLDAIVEDRVRRLRSWPKQANALSGRLNRCSTFLRTKGIEIERGKSGERYISIRKHKACTIQTMENLEDIDALSYISGMSEG